MNDQNSNERPTLEALATFINTTLLIAVEANAPAAVIDHLLQALRLLASSEPPPEFPPGAMRNP